MLQCYQFERVNKVLRSNTFISYLHEERVYSIHSILLEFLRNQFYVNVFRKQDAYSLIVGSSNLTQEALSSNKEWNIKVFSMAKGSLIQETLNEFEQTFHMAEAID